MFSDPNKNIEQFHIDPGMSVADLGCGTGFYSFALSEAIGPSGTVYAVDVQKTLLDKLKLESENRGIKNIKFIWGDLDEVGGTKLRDHSVDRVVVANVMFQLEKIESFMIEVHRIINKKSGKLLLVEWSDSFGGLGPKPENIIKSDVARTMFEDGGFVFDRNIEAGDHHYGMIFKTT
ncbi:MAG TPA: class I SAM-dependent methyltransferase [Candidatus Paceibacterota bacterium]|nr:class I SAM-dependent methyltransferase [Candidatus Paceibacterota bacterium]